MTSYFSDIVKDLRDRTDVATNALMESTETAEVSLHFITWNQHPSVSSDYLDGYIICIRQFL